jgi:hypothetical protein
MSDLVRAFFGGQSGGHRTGFNPNQRSFDWGTKMEQVANIPRELSRAGLLKRTEAADKAEATAYLAQKYVYETGRQLNALARTHQTMANHTTKTMGLAERMGRTDAKLGKAIANFQLNERVNNTSVNTYRTALQDSANALDF